jgi:hypothetical protein
MQFNYYTEDIPPNDNNSTRSSTSSRRGELERISTTSHTGNASSLIPELGGFDIACSKDQSYATHSGNRIFRQHVEAIKLRYHAAKTKAERMKITKDFVKELQSTYGSRFLKMHSSGMWFEISPFDARDKVGHAIRFALRRHVAATKSDDIADVAGAGAADMKCSRNNSSSNCSTCSTTTQSETTKSTDDTVKTAAAVSATTTTTTKNDSLETPPTPACNSSTSLNVNDLLTEPLYWDEFDSATVRQHQG